MTKTGHELSKEGYDKMRIGKVYARETVKMKKALAEFVTAHAKRSMQDYRPERVKQFKDDIIYRRNDAMFTFFKYLMEIPSINSVQPLENIPVVLVSRDKDNQVFMMSNTYCENQEMGNYFIMSELIKALWHNWSNMSGVFKK